MDNKKNIENLVKNMSDELQQLEELIKINGINKVSIKFPRCFIRTADYFREKYNFIYRKPLIDNIAYCLQVSDIYRWILNRFDLDFTAKEMLIKQGIVYLSSVIEAMCWYFVKYFLKVEPNKKFSKNLIKLKNKNFFSNELLKNIEEFKKKRDNIHLQRLEHKELKKYTINDYNEGIKIIHKIKEEIEKII
ncbi:MAG: hypothetical protein KA120_05000 [Candidatus Goldbacteria bacterium]|nr:hypothetical protein [Candidatus Goldiibacteriota bacterium]